MLDYIRIACAVPGVQPGNVEKNVADICGFLRQAEERKADVLLLPELSITGYSCGDLFAQDTLLRAAAEGLRKIVGFSAQYPGILIAVGLPVRFRRMVYNCAAVVAAGELKGIVPKSYFFEEELRNFTMGGEIRDQEITLAGVTCPFGTDLLFELGENTVVGVEICEDLFAPIPPSTLLALSGAEVILNLSASYDLAGKRKYRRGLVTRQSASARCIYAYASTGCTETSCDVVYSGHSLIAENGYCLAENQRQFDTDYLMVQDCDLGKIRATRQKNPSFRSGCNRFGGELRIVKTLSTPLRSDGILYPNSRNPFIPEDAGQLAQRCREIFNTQVTGLKQRLKGIGNADVVVGISGGLDSTLALLCAVEAMRQMGRSTSCVHGITMPCFGTSDRTHNNAWTLMEKLGITAREIPIQEAVSQHFQDIGQDPAVHDATFENAQARERTQILMDYAGRVGGIVLGTGDLSELALGWCTFNGDHMSMYGVNAGVPKTLIRKIVDAISQEPDYADVRQTLADILDTPISPELLPPDASGKIAQQTEDLVGPYELHDFFLYYMLRWGFTPAKIYALARRAFDGEYAPDVIKKWLCNFYRRFFTQQYKRNCGPDGVKVGTVCLCPRWDWRMPSDVCGSLWIHEAESL